MKFFVTGLPRMRSGWLANFLTLPPVAFCHFEACRNLNRTDLAAGLDAIKHRLNNTKARHVGDSSSALMFFLPALFAAYPDARWVWVRRPISEVTDSWWDFAQREEFPEGSPRTMEQMLYSCGIMDELLAKLDGRKNVLQVNFDDLDKMEACESIWNWCIPGEPFHVERWRLLDMMRVNVITAKQERLTQLEGAQL